MNATITPRGRWLVLGASLIGISLVPVSAAVAGAPWPRSTPQAEGFNVTAFEAALNRLPSPAVVIKNGKIVGQKGDISRAGFVWSASKSLTALIGARLIQTGHITLDTPVPGSNVPVNPAATYRQFMSMTSDYGLFPHRPGNAYAYNNGGVTYYGDYMRTAFFPGQDHVEMLRSAYLDHIGFEDSLAFSGFISGWDGGWAMSTRDLARIGYLILQNGVWNGTQVLPSFFVNSLYQNQIPSGIPLHPDLSNAFYNESPYTLHMKDGYSFGFWLPHRARQFGHVVSRHEAISMSGAFGTSMHISRHHNLILAAVNTQATHTHGGGQIPASSLDEFVAALAGATTTPVVASPLPPSPPLASQSVASFTLVNADTDRDIQTLVSGAVLNLGSLPTRNLNVRANTAPGTVGSVVFTLNGVQARAENGAPYTLAGDLGGNYHRWTPALGSHTLTATPFTHSSGGGTAGTLRSVSFTVTDSVTAASSPPPPPLASPSVTSFTLVDAETNQDIQTLASGAVLNRSLRTRKLNVRANTSPGTVGSVVFTLNGVPARTENGAPYALGGDVAGDYQSWTPAPGSHTLTAIPFAGTNGSGTPGTAHTVTFTVQ